MTDKEIFEVLGIEEDNWQDKRYQKLLPQFRKLNKKYDANLIWLKGDYSISACGKVLESTKDLIVVEEE